jgi:hypothetical protein
MTMVVVGRHHEQKQPPFVIYQVGSYTLSVKLAGLLEFDKVACEKVLLSVLTRTVFLILLGSCQVSQNEKRHLAGHLLHKSEQSAPIMSTGGTSSGQCGS